MLTRRSFFQIAAPAVIFTPGLLMPLRGLVLPQESYFWVPGDLSKSLLRPSFGELYDFTVEEIRKAMQIPSHLLNGETK